MKVLFIQNVAYRVNAFALSSAIAANRMGFEFHLASSWTGYSNDIDRIADEEKYGIIIHQIDFIREPYNPKNIRAYKQIVDLIKKEHIDLIHCNTPIGGVIGRLAGLKCGIKPVIYQAHGFHFFSGAPLLNWLIYYPIEKILGHFTDAIITINSEDYSRAKNKFKLRNDGIVYYLPGVGIDTSLYQSSTCDKGSIRKSLGIPYDSIVLISVGDLNKNKNVSTVINAIKLLSDNSIHYILCGDGPLREELELQSETIKDQVHFLGYRTDVKDLLMISDIFIISSFREGLSRSLMEAMACGLPCIASNIRGNVDLLYGEKGGLLVDPKDVVAWKDAISSVVKDNNRSLMGIYNKSIINDYSLETVIKKTEIIYQQIIADKGFGKVN